MEKILKKILMGIVFILIGGTILSIVGVIGFVIFRTLKGLFGW
jgi:hypothetical protein